MKHNTPFPHILERPGSVKWYNNYIDNIDATAVKVQNLSHGEGVPCSLDELFHTLEPSLVTSLRLKQVQLPILHCGSDQLVLASFVSVCGTSKHAELVVRPSVDHHLRGLQYRCGSHSVGQEPSLRLRLPRVALPSEQE